MTQVSSRLSDSFAVRLSLALKALNMSRAQLAAAVGVDKSLVSRWVSGQVVPTGYNLARISGALAANRPGFNMTLWDRPRAEFELFLGLGTAVPIEDAAGNLGRAHSRAETASGSASTAAPGATSGSPTSVSSRPPRNSWIAVMSATLLVLIVGGLGLWRFWPARVVQAPPAPAEASVAVLAFVNMSGDPEKEYFSDGFSEQLINDLSNVPHLRVASRTSSFVFKNRNEDVQSIARALRVHAIVEGSVREAGERVRITSQLIDARDGYHIWSATYDRNLTDILSVQGELARAIATALTNRLVPASAIPHPVIDPAVYRLYLEGLHQYDLGPPQGWRNARAIFRQVTAKAPDFADGFAWLARVANSLAANFDIAPASDYASASDAAQRALSLDRHNSLARAMRAEVEMDTWEWRAAAADLRILRDQSPNNYFAIAELWNFYLLLGFPDEALAEWQHLSVIDPIRYRDDYQTLWAFDDAGRFPEEIVTAHTQLLDRPRDTDRLDLLCRAYAGAGRVAEARAVRERLLALQVDFDSRADFQDCDGVIALATDNRTEFLKVVQIFEAAYPDKVPFAAGLGVDYAVSGDFDKATGWFERAYERREAGFFRCFYLRGFGQESAFAKYRATAGYKTLAQEPLFREWQAEHDHVATALANHRDPLN